MPTTIDTSAQWGYIRGMSSETANGTTWFAKHRDQAAAARKRRNLAREAKHPGKGNRNTWKREK
jgi:hypothetical protein